MKPIQSSDQLGISNVKILFRGLRVRCPACNGKETQQSWFKMKERCPTCDLKFERIEGHAIGYIGINTIITFGATFLVLLGGSILTHPDIAVWPILGAALCTSLLLPTIFLPAARTFWTAIDLVLRPLKPTEIDPRFLVLGEKALDGQPTKPKP